MRQASTLFDKTRRDAVQQAVADAERQTLAEIVPVVATASGRYDRAEDIVGLWLGAAAMTAALTLLPAAPAEAGSWGDPQPWHRLAAAVVALVVGFMVGAIVAGRVGWLRLLFTPRRQMRDEVAARAHAVFFDTRVHHTAGRAGLLIYVSLHERMAVVLADDAVLNKLGRQAVDGLCATLTGKLRRKEPLSDAISETIREAGQRLAAVLPRAADDVNELSDALILLDAR